VLFAAFGPLEGAPACARCMSCTDLSLFTMFRDVDPHVSQGTSEFTFWQVCFLLRKTL